LLTDVFTHHPATILVFARHRMACVGCPLAEYVTLADALHTYQLDPQIFLSKLHQAIDSYQ
jgi:hybrid cluster-associated redox disulfide protein